MSESTEAIPKDTNKAEDTNTKTMPDLAEGEKSSSEFDPIAKEGVGLHENVNKKLSDTKEPAANINVDTATAAMDVNVENTKADVCTERPGEVEMVAGSCESFKEIGDAIVLVGDADKVEGSVEVDTKGTEHSEIDLEIKNNELKATTSTPIGLTESGKDTGIVLEFPLEEKASSAEKTKESVNEMDVDNVLTKVDDMVTAGSEAEERNDDSQESTPLIIDEKPATPEELNTEIPCTSIDQMNSNNGNMITKISADDSKPLPQDETIATIAKLVDENNVEAMKEDEQPTAKLVGCEAVQDTVIEIDDDVEITETRSASYIPVIEIDDDDDDVPQSDSKAQKVELKTGSETTTTVKEITCSKEHNGTDGEKLKNLQHPQIGSLQDKETGVAQQKQPDEITQVTAGKTNEDVEMKDISETDHTNIEKSNDLLTSTATPQTEITKKTNTDTDESGFEENIDEVFYNKECINHDCPHNHKQFFQAPHFALSHFKVKRRHSKHQYICADCYDNALEIYEEYCSLLKAKHPLLLKNITVQGPEFVEITDSSDDEDDEPTASQLQSTKGSFSKKDLDLIEAELENSIKSVLENLEIQNQLTWSKTILATRARRLEEESNLNDELLRALQKKADHMYSSLYQCPKIRLRQFQPLDLNTGLPYVFPEVATCPPVGEILRPSIEINQIYYAVKNKAIASWVPCKVVESVDPGVPGGHPKVTHYKVKFLKLQYQMVKTVSAKHLAYYDPPKVRLPIGSRVIAYFDATSLSRGKEKMLIQSAFYPGIIAEPLKPNNKYRYLIFYDDGYTQYVSHKDVRLVCNVSEHVWEDVHPASREFIQKYLTQYSINRPMVQTQKGQSMTTESNGKWIYARVIDIDCSLIQMQFEGPKSHTEWIYRGSLRLGPVFKEYQKTLQKDTLPMPRLARRTEPFIRYTADEEATTVQQQQQQAKTQERERTSPNETRAVAKKSVSRLSLDSTTPAAATAASSSSQTPSLPTVRHLNNSTIYLEDENKPKGKVVYYTAKRDLPPLIYRPHKCSPTCLFKIPHNLSAYSPLSKPLLSGWERPIMRLKSKKMVAYRGPCGKIMRNMEEVRRYLRATNNVLNVDNFDFHHETSCLAEYVIESAIVQKRDISGGQEKMAIPLVNYYDSTLPPECKYAAQRIPTDGVNLNLDPNFLVGCDCDGDCSDKQKCSCWQLTYAGAKYGNPNTPVEEIGYQYKRLYDHVPTGIYECNSRCKCKSNCLNRVAQQPLAMKLQVFKTSNRGWGLRCINDVPRGSFVCIYAGHLLTEAKANEGGLDAGDEYFAELDYIEVAEQIKEGYESDVEAPEVEEEEESYAPDPEDDDEFTPSKSFLTRSKNRAQKLTRSSSGQNTDEDSQERQVINFNPNADMKEDSGRDSSIRTLFGKDEACYVMDAKITGNLGRYFNHSCSPNLFVQNVFVDTHDLRFPWVAFFSSTNIRAGTELTWNYNYEVGVVPGKVLYCQCGAPNCRLRLL